MSRSGSFRLQSLCISFGMFALCWFPVFLMIFYMVTECGGRRMEGEPYKEKELETAFTPPRFPCGTATDPLFLTSTSWCRLKKQTVRCQLWNFVQYWRILKWHQDPWKIEQELKMKKEEGTDLRDETGKNPLIVTHLNCIKITRTSSSSSLEMDHKGRHLFSHRHKKSNSVIFNFVLPLLLVLLNYWQGKFSFNRATWRI